MFNNAKIEKEKNTRNNTQKKKKYKKNKYENKNEKKQVIVSIESAVSMSRTLTEIFAIIIEFSKAFIYH